MATLPRFIRRGHGLPAFAAAALGFMVLVILWGAVVRATGSGAGCGNHWPLCNGDFVPRHPRLATIIEFTHRSMSGICTTLIAVLLAWTLLTHPRGHRARRAAGLSAFLLVTEALLGAILVKGGYVEHNASPARVFMQCVHFSNTMLLLAALTLTWRWLQPGHRLTPAPDAAALSVTALLCTLLSGVTGSVAALADTLFPSPDLRTALLADFSRSAPLLIRMRWIHPASVALVSLVVFALYVRHRSPSTNILAGLVLLQLVTGLLDVLFLAPVSLQVVHLLLADLFWIALVSYAAVELAPAFDRSKRAATLVQPRGVPV